MKRTVEILIYVTKRGENVTLEMSPRQGQRMKSVQVLAEQSCLQRQFVPCGVTSLPQLCRNCPFPNSRRQSQPSANGSLGSAALSAQQCVSVVWDCQFSLRTSAEKHPEPMANPTVSFHMQQENFVVSAGIASKHPPASLDASACWIFCVGFATCHVSSWLPSIVPGCASASQQGSVASIAAS